MEASLPLTCFRWLRRPNSSAQCYHSQCVVRRRAQSMRKHALKAWENPACRVGFSKRNSRVTANPQLAAIGGAIRLSLRKPANLGQSVEQRVLRRRLQFCRLYQLFRLYGRYPLAAVNPLPAIDLVFAVGSHVATRLEALAISVGLSLASGNGCCRPGAGAIPCARPWRLRSSATSPRRALREWTLPAGPVSAWPISGSSSCSAALR